MSDSAPDHETGMPPFEYSRITDQVRIGTNACCKMHFDATLLKEGVTVDVSLEGEHLDQPYGVGAFFWLPTQDHTAPDRDLTIAGIEMLDSALKSGKKAYIHCKNGHGRAPTFFAAYLIKKRGHSPETALKTITNARPSAHLEPAQVEFLRKLSEEPS